MDKQEIHDLFMEQARLVWNNSPLLEQIRVNVVFDNSTKSMSLSTSGHPKAFGRSVYQMAKEYTLHISDFALAYDYDRFVRTLRHEAIHLGIMRHTDDFFEVAKETGAVLTGANEKGYGYQVQVQDVKGGRFRLVKKFDDFESAKQFQNDLVKHYRENNVKFKACRIKM